jgi:LacI family transcriptional regulator
MAVKIIDIALKAKVSPAAVSLVLNGKQGVGAETRNRVLKIARELNYQNHKIKNLLDETTETIRFLRIIQHGHTVNRDHEIFIADYFEGLSDGAGQLGYNLEIDTFSGVSAESIIQTINAETVKGVIILGTEMTASEILEFKKLDLPIVFIDTYQDFLPFDFVDMNNKDAVYRVIQYFIENGYDDIGIIHGNVNTENFILRNDAFRSVMKRFGLAVEERNIFSVDSTFNGAYEDMLKLLKSGVRLPSALFSDNDIMAYGCIKAMNEMGIRVPEDVGIVGFDDLPLASVMSPRLTTVRVSKKKIGTTAIQLIHDRIRSSTEFPPVKVLIGGQLIIRESVLRNKRI